MEVFMKKETVIKGWQLSYAENARVRRDGITVSSALDLEKYGLPSMVATVPGAFELDFMREGLLPDIYYGIGSTVTQKYENLHLYYYTRFELKKSAGFNSFLRFDGIDTVAEIYLDGVQIGFTENMFHAHRFPLDGVEDGTHELLVHILPATIYSRQFEIPSMCFALPFNQDALMLRKAASMFGWDIMPRIVSGGLWRDVFVEEVPVARITNHYTYTKSLTKDKGRATLVTNLKIVSDEDFITDYRIVVHGVCGEHSFHREYKPYCAAVQLAYDIENPILWWPKNYGEPSLYDVKISLYYKGTLCDEMDFRLGIRTLWLKRTSLSGDDGEFCFIVNGQKIFVMGTNWVPCDALPARHDDYTLRNAELTNELGCNMIRCWGGNVYPSELFYNYCDEHGIMIWQDFALACGHYPDDDRLNRLMRREVAEIVKEKRQHPSLALWAGDNECDGFVVPYADDGLTDGEQPSFINPNFNRLTRSVILREVREHDAIRPYLPSSPYIDQLAYEKGHPAEQHLWGPRDYFKGEYYGTAPCHFASEIGYHGCPSPDGIKKYIPEESLPKHSITEIYENPDWLVHAAGMMTTTVDNPYAYRLPLMVSQVERIFGEAKGNLNDFARQSQISQAEAKKYFIERFRIAKWRKTGLLWWNIIDGWPQISDAVVDYYGIKKLAYHYIKRSQKQFAMMCDEPKNGKVALCAANDYQRDMHCTYEVIDLVSGDTVASGEVTVPKNTTAVATEIAYDPSAFLLIKWKGDAEGVNHFVTNIGEGWTYEGYVECMKKAGFYGEFEGFSED